MNKLKLILLVAVVASCAIVISSPAQAGHPWLNGGYRFSPFNYFNFEMPYAMSRVPTPPYFSLHPPVYYSSPVPRSYGYSPYAYPPTVQTPEISLEPAVFTNPYVESSTEPVEPSNSGAVDTDHHTAAATPQVIENPFVRQAVATQVNRSKIVD